MPRASDFGGALSPKAIADALRLSEGMPEWEETRESLEQKIALLEARAAVLTGLEKNPYQTSFRAFLKDCVWTADEARGGRVAQAPDWPFLDHFCDLLIERPIILVEKSRRVFASWTICAEDVWVAAGGQDDRWRGSRTDEHPEGEPTLMFNTGRRQVYIVSRKYESSVFFLHRRVRFMVEQLEARNIREKWPDFPFFTWRENDAQLSNGSVITAVAQGSDQLRGPGATLVHLEELAFWEQAQQTVEGLFPIVQGGGHVVAVTTPQAATYAHDIREGTLKSRGLMRN